MELLDKHCCVNMEVVTLSTTERNIKESIPEIVYREKDMRLQANEKKKKIRDFMKISRQTS